MSGSASQSLRYNPSIQITGPAVFQDQVKKDLDRFLSTHTGQLWLKAFADTRRTVTIVPTNEALSSADRTIAGGDSIVKFDSNALQWYKTVEGSVQLQAPYQNLAHELIHTLHPIEQDDVRDPVQGMPAEEAATIGIPGSNPGAITENALYAELGQPLRAEHQLPYLLYPSERADGPQWVFRNREGVQRFPEKLDLDEIPSLMENGTFHLTEDWRNVADPSQSYSTAQEAMDHVTPNAQNALADANLMDPDNLSSFYSDQRGAVPELSQGFPLWAGVAIGIVAVVVVAWLLWGRKEKPNPGEVAVGRTNTQISTLSGQFSNFYGPASGGLSNADTPLPAQLNLVVTDPQGVVVDQIETPSAASTFTGPGSPDHAYKPFLSSPNNQVHSQTPASWAVMIQKEFISRLGSDAGTASGRVTSAAGVNKEVDGQ